MYSERTLLQYGTDKQQINVPAGKEGIKKT